MSTILINGLSRFEWHLRRVENLLYEAASQPDPAMWLYENDLRTPVFMLEGLCRIYRNITSKERFTKLGDKFKKIEDDLGRLDYYVSFLKEVEKDKTTNSATITWLTDHKVNSLGALNQRLLDKNWLNGKRIGKIINQLQAVAWPEPKHEVALIKKVYQAEIKKITEFVQESGYPFTHMEETVHELRRKLRWLGIYAQALLGLIQLKEGAKQANLKKYLTPAIVKSPYNVMPQVLGGQSVLYLDKEAFYALSWLINQLGDIKDQGLKVMMLAEAGKTSNSNKTKDKPLPEKEIKALLPLLKKAEEATQRFMKDQVLQKLVV